MPHQTKGSEPQTEQRNVLHESVVVDDKERVAGVAAQEGTELEVLKQLNELIAENHSEPKGDHGGCDGARALPLHGARGCKDRVGNRGKEHRYGGDGK